MVYKVTKKQIKRLEQFLLYCQDIAVGNLTPNDLQRRVSYMQGMIQEIKWVDEIKHFQEAGK